VAQRAFRERKERHVKGLEDQLQELHEKYQNLLQSYLRQDQEATRLSQIIKELTSELELLRSARVMSFGDVLMPQNFHVMSYPNITHTGPEYDFDKDVTKLRTSIKFSQLDDSL
jgi:DNA repair exonuclease SbcCD ATPase subunit